MDFKKMAAAFAAGGAILAAGAAYSLNHKKQQNPYVTSGQGQRAFISGSTLSALSAGGAADPRVQLSRGEHPPAGL